MSAIRITGIISIDESELKEEFIRSSGPGGQNINKVSTAVQLRFDVGRSTCLPKPAKDNLIRLAGKRMTADGLLVIVARRFRTRERNRQDARGRLATLVTKACEKPKPRKKTVPTQASRRRRLESKRRKGDAKSLRSAVKDDEA
ncbi:alternative ribosome rescue aminoacyl-tRNA hydrolase ArfB [Fibrobacterota bacterium]